jgi:hypothetical protein
MKISVGDKVWFIWCNLAVLGEVVGINDYFRKQDPSGVLFYDLDEPIGHDLSDIDLYDSLESLLKENSVEVLEYNEKDSTSLYETRISNINFIVKTHGLSPEQTQKSELDLLSNCKEKIYFKDWFILMENSHDS